MGKRFTSSRYGDPINQKHRALPSDTPHRLVSDQMRRAESMLWVLGKRQDISFVRPESLVQIK
jgi:hypothetical protein